MTRAAINLLQPGEEPAGTISLLLEESVEAAYPGLAEYIIHFNLDKPSGSRQLEEWHEDVWMWWSGQRTAARMLARLVATGSLYESHGCGYSRPDAGC